ncbi:MAG: hypothetical protein RL174_334 [Actinomycetota bacterium]|jgi:hypothetical protein
MWNLSLQNLLLPDASGRVYTLGIDIGGSRENDH